jgi:hypothetical protein
MSEKSDECFILIKAQPHRSSKYFETVCCAGVGRDHKWRRQYPVPFRILQDSQKFGRWSWIKYRFVSSEQDRRAESQKVLPETLIVGDPIRSSERANFLQPLVRSSFAEADERRESLCLIRPRNLELRAIAKSESEIRDEAQKHKDLADQMSLFDATAEPLKPCAMSFFVDWVDQDGKSRSHECDDWETSAAYNRFEREYGSSHAIEILKRKYEEEYFKAGLVLGFSTHSRRNIEFGTQNQWLLVGLIRLNETSQSSLLL